MEIKKINDLKTAADLMHDSEFNGQDFGYDPREKVFYLKSRSTGKEFSLKVYNVEKYDPVNLEKINMKRATAGVFDDIRIEDKGLSVKILSQDLNIRLRLSKLEGKLEINEIQ